ncbi:DUF1846 family protein [Mycoplasma anatis]|uniref:DUF1846 domain-containing protein n=1 Tax=Mycoplasmopsis anatis TaxID=171279 RepID=UPI001C4E9317|nr:DUF1846 domain-containing protein [Mycoplasmopsis anatis]MBW0597261.1 DUF1846 family protein [Mycoplasmopsis anatis]MBW0599948.1 DUF1846 family protein [Mycoplasmopsis anatis]
MKKCFDKNKYINSQIKRINQRIELFKNKLYLEFGGKIFDDYHASRVLPGFEPDTKISMLYKLKDKIEFMICINAEDVISQKIRSDIGISYEQDLFRLIEQLSNKGFYVGSVVITHYNNQEKIKSLTDKLDNLKIQYAYHYKIENYPIDVDYICSENGFGKNQYIKTKRELIIVTAPGPGSGKLATCLSQIYNDYQNNIKSGYAKFETFPVWNIELNHPINLAYEAATVDLNDINMIDPFHYQKYKKIAINYNRDIESFPILQNLLKKIMDQDIYFSPTDMGVNMLKKGIIDFNLASSAAKEEIVRRYFNIKLKVLKDYSRKYELDKIKSIMDKLNIDQNIREVYKFTKSLAVKNNKNYAAFFVDNKLISGKESELFEPSAAALLNTLKVISNIDIDQDVLPFEIINQLLLLKKSNILQSSNKLKVYDVLTTIAIQAKFDKNCKLMFNNLNKLNNCEFHSSKLLSKSEEETLRKLGVNITQELINN